MGSKCVCWNSLHLLPHLETSSNRRSIISKWDGLNVDIFVTNFLGEGRFFVLNYVDIKFGKFLHIAEVHLADAVERIVERSQESLSKNREPKNPY